jgi:hypothetical protein
MSDTLLLPVFVLLLGFVSVMFFELPRHLVAQRAAAARSITADTPAPVLD